MNTRDGERYRVKFSELNLHPLLKGNIEKLNYQDCTPIQELAIPIARTGKDVAGLAQTGTGKTAAFLIPIIDRMLWGREEVKPEGLATVPFVEWKKRQFVLVLVPTRELAEQVQESAEKFLEGTGYTSVSIYGGTSYDKQIAGFKNGAEFVIATPGRLIDLYKEHVADLGQVRAVIFDEADRMFDMGFKDDMKFVLRRLPRERQFLVFSATLNFDVLNVAYEFGADPVEVNISRDQATAEHVKDFIFHLGQDEKPSYLLSLLKKRDPKQTIIFSNFKRNVERIARFLTKNGVPAVGISSLLTQSQRNRVMEQFKAKNDRNILVATDLAARGLDILGVDLVINFELPDDPENYVHRIGRTGRAGAEGTAFSFVSDRDVDALARIESFIKRKIEAQWLEEVEILKDFERFPSMEEVEGKKPFGKPRGSGSDAGRQERHPQRDSRPPRGGGARAPHRDRQAGGRHGEQRPSRPTEARGPRHESQGPRHESQGPRRDNRGPRRETRAPVHESQRGGAEQARFDKNRGPRRPESARPHSKNSNGQVSKRPQGGLGGRSASSLVAKKTIGTKVAGFFKKLFGTD